MWSLMLYLSWRVHSFLSNCELFVADNLRYHFSIHIYIYIYIYSTSLVYSLDYGVFVLWCFMFNFAVYIDVSGKKKKHKLLDLHFCTFVNFNYSEYSWENWQMESFFFMLFFFVISYNHCSIIVGSLCRNTAV